MAKRYRVVVTQAAADDLAEIVDYIGRRDSRKAAERQLARLKRHVQTLRTTPTRGRAPPELADDGIQTWLETLVGPWRIVYRIERATVYVLVVIDGRRDLRDMLLRRLTRP